jgi:hypothetical protein
LVWAGAKFEKGVLIERPGEAEIKGGRVINQDTPFTTLDRDRRPEAIASGARRAWPRRRVYWIRQIRSVGSLAVGAHYGLIPDGC